MTARLQLDGSRDGCKVVGRLLCCKQLIDVLRDVLHRDWPLAGLSRLRRPERQDARQECEKVAVEIHELIILLPIPTTHSLKHPRVNLSLTSLFLEPGLSYSNPTLTTTRAERAPQTTTHHVSGQPRPRLLTHAERLSGSTRRHIHPSITHASLPLPATPKARFSQHRHPRRSHTTRKTATTHPRRHRLLLRTNKINPPRGRSSHTAKPRFQKAMAGHEVLGWRARLAQDEVAVKAYKAHLAEQQRVGRDCEGQGLQVYQGFETGWRVHFC